MDHKDVKLTDGRTVRVYAPPGVRISAIVEKLLPKPQPEAVTETNKVGKEFVTFLDKDPAYLAKLNEWNQARNEKADELGSLFMLKDEEPPDDWDVEAEVGEEMRYFDPDWKPREGKVGRRLDYLQWSILADVVNSRAIYDALRELSGIDLEEVARNLDSFRDPVEGETA